jgi:hypothetical protein
MPSSTESQSNTSILKEAESLIYGDRNQQYGHPLDNHSTTAAFFNAYLAALRRRGKHELDAEDVCWLNVLQKVSREATTGARKRDTAVDVAGYAGNVEMVRDERYKRESAAETFGPLPT